MTLRGKGLAIGLGLVAGGALLTTILMSRHAGEMMGATDEGRRLLSQGAIVVDVAVCLSGMAATAFVLSPGWFRKTMGAVFLMLTLGLVTLAVFSITNFIAAERMSVQRAEEERARLAEERRDAERKAAERRQAAEEARLQAALKAQQDLAKTQLGYMQAQVKDARGRERKTLSKDFASGAAKIIAEVGKQASPAETPAIPTPLPDESKVALHTAAGPELMAEVSGYDQKAISAAQIGGIAIALIIIEALFSMGAGLAWRLEEEPRRALPRQMPAASAIVDAEAVEVPALPAPAVPTAPAPSPEPIRTKVAEPAPPAPPPPPPEPVSMPGAIVPVLAEGAEPSLGAILFNSRLQPTGARREKDDPSAAADRLVTWLRAYGMGGSYTSDTILALHADFCRRDHREQTPAGPLLNAVAKHRHVKKWRPRANGARMSTWIYSIEPGKFPKPKPASPAETEQAEPGAQVVRPRAFFRELEDEPALRRALSHVTRRLGRNRKQRGAVRRVA